MSSDFRSLFVSRRLRSPLVWAGAVFLLALALRLAYVTWFVGWDYVPQLDAAEYSAIAESLAAGRGYRLASGELTAIRPPLFPLVLAGVYALFGVHYGAALVMQAILGALTCVVVYRAGAQALGEGPGRLAGVMAAGYPLLIYNDGQLLSETAFVLGTTLALWAMLRLEDSSQNMSRNVPHVVGGATANENVIPSGAERSEESHLAGGKRPLASQTWLRVTWAGVFPKSGPQTQEVIVLGAMLGLAALTRPNGLVLWMGAVAWSLWYWGRRAWPIMVGFTVVVAALLAPWVIRNQIAMGAFIPFSTMGGAVLLGSYNEIILNDPTYWGDWVSPCWVRGARCGEGLSEVARDRLWSNMALTFVRTHLTDLPAMAFWRFVNFWHLYRFTRGFPENLGFYAYVAVALLAAAGTWLYRAQWRRLSPLYVVVICFTVNALVFWGGFRMRAPVEPVLLILAAGALSKLGGLVSGIVTKDEHPIRTGYK